MEDLCVNYTRVENLTPLEGMPLRILMCQNTAVRNIDPLANLPLEELYLIGCQIDDISPIRNLKLKKMTIDYDPEKHYELLSSIPTLEVINEKPASEILVKAGE
ncbi:MAG: leucine-rich repeat domain-containing protein [Planctomycetaceae bacterium]